MGDQSQEGVANALQTISHNDGGANLVLNPLTGKFEVKGRNEPARAEEIPVAEFARDGFALDAGIAYP